MKKRGGPAGVAKAVRMALRRRLTGHQMRVHFAICRKRPAGSDHVDRGGTSSGIEGVRGHPASGKGEQCARDCVRAEGPG